MNLFISIILLISSSLYNEPLVTKNQNSQFELEINITNINYNGNIFVGIYNNALDFNSQNDSQKKITYSTKQRVETGSFSKKIILKKDVYTIKVFIDKNVNNKFDFNFFGIPKEQYGFSNNAMGIFGPQNSQEASLKLNSNISIKTKMK